MGFSYWMPSSSSTFTSGSSCFYFSADFKTFDKHLQDLQAKVAPVVRRLDEWSKRPTAINRTVTEILTYWKKLDKLNKTMPWLTND